MMTLDEITKKVLEQIDASGFKQSGAFNLRHNGIALCHGDSEHIKIKKKQDKPGIDIYIDGKTDGEEVHIPVVVDATGMTDVVYNDFYIGKNAKVYIIAGCGIHNDHHKDSQHDGIHRFFLEEGAHVTYVEKHYGEGNGDGKRILNPVTEVHLKKGSSMDMNSVQIKGVDSTVRVTKGVLEDDTNFVVSEKIMTHGNQYAETLFEVELNGENSSTQVTSRSVATEDSKQKFMSKVFGNNKCFGHVECDAIIKDNGTVQAIPEISANSVEANLIHEAAIGKIAGEQLTKLMTLGLTEKEAEEEIIKGFLR